MPAKLQVTVTLSESLDTRLREYAAKSGLSTSRAAAQILADMLDAKPAPPHGGKREKK